MPFDVTNAPPSASQIDQQQLPVDGTVVPLGLPLQQQQQAGQASGAAASSSAAVGGLTDQRVTDIRASKLGAVYAATASANAGQAGPVLPYAKAAAAPPAEASQFVGSLSPNGILAFQILREAGEKGTELERKAQQGLQTGYLGAMFDSAQESIKKAEGETKSATLKFMGSMAGVAASGALGAGGAGFFSRGASSVKPAGLESTKSTEAKLASNLASGETKLSPTEKKALALEEKKKQATSRDDQSDSGASAQSSQPPAYEPKSRAADSGSALDPAKDSSLLIQQAKADRSIGLSTDNIEKDTGKVAKNKPASQTAASPDGNGRATHAEKSLDHDDASSASTSSSGWKQSAASAMVQSAGGVITSGVDALDQTVGGAHEAKQAEIAAKFIDVNQTILKNLYENGKQQKERWTKTVDDAIQATRTHFDLQSSTDNKIFS